MQCVGASHGFGKQENVDSDILDKVTQVIQSLRPTLTLGGLNQTATTDATQDELI